MRGQRHDPAAPYPGKEPVPIVQKAGWASGPVWTGVENLAHFVHSTVNNIHANEFQQDDTSASKHAILYSGKKKI